MDSGWCSAVAVRAHGSIFRGAPTCDLEASGGSGAMGSDPPEVDSRVGIQVKHV